MRIPRPILLASLLLLTACGEDHGPVVLLAPGLATPARVTIQLIDAPFPLELVETTSFTMTRVIVHVATGDDDSSTLQTVNWGERRVDLLDLRNGVAQEIFKDDVPSGRIARVDLFVDEASVTLVDGRRLDVILPDDLKTGIKVEPARSLEATSSRATELLLDFDMGRSLSPIPKAADETHEVRHFLLQPALRLVDRSTTGILSGTVMDDSDTSENTEDDRPLAGATVMAYLDGEEITGTATESNGAYKLMGLEGRRHTLVAFAKGFEPDTMAANVLVAGEVRGQDFSLSRSRTE